jgi:hypothetical protein
MAAVVRSRQPLPKEDDFTLANMLTKIPGKLQMDRDAIAEGLRMEKIGLPGWSMHLLRGIGINPKNIPDTFGFCHGCLSTPVATIWFVQNFAREFPTDRVKMSNSFVVLSAKSFAPVFDTKLPFTNVDWEPEPYRGLPTQSNQKVIEDCVKSFQDSERLNWYLFLTEMRTSSSEAHVMFTVVSREKPGDVSLKVETYDPNGYAAAAFSVDEFLQVQLMSVGRTSSFQYAISDQTIMQCSGNTGVQTMMYAQRLRPLTEPEGYCAVWSNVFIFLSYFVGPNKTLSQMQADLQFCISRNKAEWYENLTYLARALSRGFANIFHTQGRPPAEVCEVMSICCARDFPYRKKVPDKYKGTYKERELMETTSLCNVVEVHPKSPV